MFFGFLCGIVSIPVGCFVGGLVLGIGALPLLLNLLPLIILAVIVVLGLIFAPEACIKIFRVFGFIMKLIITLGLVAGVFTAVTGITIVEEFESVYEGARICFAASVTLCGAFPLMFIISKLLNRPMGAIGKKMGINSTSAVCLIPNIVTNATTFAMMNKMDKKGVVLNSALTVTVAFALGSHLGFTMAHDSAYVLPMIVAKLVSGALALIVALLIYKEDSEFKKQTK